MITINKRMFQTSNTIPEMVEKIVIQGMLEETNFRMKDFDGKIKLTDDQVKWIAQFVSTDDRVVKLDGARQSGRTSMGVGMVLATALFQDDSMSVLMSANEQMVKHHQTKFLDYLRTFCEIFSLPELISFRNREQIELINGSRILFRRNTSCALCGTNLDSIFIDLFNVHTIDDLDEDLVASAMPCVYANHGKLIVSLGV